MKQKLLIFSWVTMGSMMILMLIGSFFAKADDPKTINDTATYVGQFCFEGNFDKMDTSDLAKLYTQKTNDFFNANIAVLMSNPTMEIPTPDLSRYSESIKLCGEENSSNPIDMTCRAISVCLTPGLVSDNLPQGTQLQNNPSPYCVGAIALGFTPERFVQYAQKYSDFVSKVQAYTQLKYGYFCYKAALELKRDDLTDGTPLGILRKCDTNEDFRNKTDICKTKAEWDKETDPTRKKMLEQKIAAGFGADQTTDPSIGQVLGQGVSNTATEVFDGLSSTIGLSTAATRSVERVKYVDKELARAKQAIDQTLDAYSQLRTAWAMHIKYVDVFSALVKYRDGLVSIRRQTDNFPNKFIDATTTHCQ